MKKVLVIAVVVLLIAALATPAMMSSCNQPTSTNTNVEVKPQPAIVVNAPLFSKDSAFAYTKAQCDFGPRDMNSKGHEACAKWMVEKMKQLADTVYIQKFEVRGFDGVMLKCTNIIASFNPQATTRVLFTTHWDTRPWADQDDKDRDKPIIGACDGASGVGALIEMARAMKTQPLKIGVDILFNDAEDRGYSSAMEGLAEPVGETGEDSYCLGTQHWSKNPHVAGYHADFGILLDMVGARSAIFTREQTSAFSAGWVLDKVWGNAAQLGYTNFFTNQTSGPITDDHVYINTQAHIPTIDVIHLDQNGFGDFWHTHEDNMSIIDPATLEAVGRTLLYTLYQYDAEKSSVQ